MKYLKVLAWVRSFEQEELKKEFFNIPILFVNNKRLFQQKITSDSYLIVSLAFVNKKFKHIADKYSNNIFNLYELKSTEEQTAEQSLLMGYNNITDGQYSAFELKQNYLNIIPDLWKYRLTENPTIINC